jgi:hypothetical protein
MEMTVVWDVAPCTLVEIDQRFRGAHCHHQGDDGSEPLIDGGRGGSIRSKRKETRNKTKVKRRRRIKMKIWTGEE